MFNLSKLILNHQFLKLIKSEKKQINKCYCTKQARVFSKILYGSKHKRKWYTDNLSIPTLPNPVELSKGAYEGKKSINFKRIAVLNKLFMKYISDLLSTGSSYSELIGHGIEITKVQIAPDFKKLNVFWFSKDKIDIENLSELLTKNANTLRHELSQLRVIGIVPKIYFLKDKENIKLAEIDYKLALADYGDDYFPTDPSLHLKNEFIFKTKLNQDIKDNINELSNQNIEEEWTEVPLPPMVNDVFGLDHNKIMTKIKIAMTKSKAPHRQSCSEPSMISSAVPLNTSKLNFVSSSDQSKLLVRFLQEQRLKKNQLTKKREKRLLDEISLDDSNDNINNDFIDEIKDNDYFSEIIKDKH